MNKELISTKGFFCFFKPTEKRITSKDILFEFIRQEFQKINNSVYKLNAGGCGIFAEFAYRSLVNVGLKPELAVLTRPNEMTVDKVKESLRNNASAFEVPFNHVVLIIGKKLIDSNGVHNHPRDISEHYSRLHLVKGLDVELLKEWNSNPYNWNTIFDRKKIPLIQKRMRKFEKALKDVLNNEFLFI